MTLWARVTHEGRECFGTVEGDTLRLHAGNMLANPRPTGESIPLSVAKLLTPTSPSKMVALVDNYHALVAKLNHAVPAEPLYFLKAGNSFLAGGETIRAPQSYAGKVVYEGELGIVIGKRCSAVAEAAAERCIFGYTCINDVTAIEIIARDPSFAQWTRAKSFDTFGVFGPVIVTGRSDEARRQDDTQRPGAAELSRRGHHLRARETREPHLAGHDAGSGRRDRLRDFDGRRLDEAGQRGQHRHRRHRRADKSVRVRRRR